MQLALVKQFKRIRAKHDVFAVDLTCGVFQNRLLTEYLPPDFVISQNKCQFWGIRFGGLLAQNHPTVYSPYGRKGGRRRIGWS